MNRTIIALALALSFGSAYATQGGEGNNTGCNGVGNANSPCAGTTNNGGQGGQGGAGGNASIKSYTDIRSTNINQNLNANVNANVNTSSSSSAATGGASTATAAAGDSSATASAPTTVAPNQTVIVEGSNTPKQAVSGPGIGSSPSATCRVAVGISVGGTFGGVGAFGSTLDEECRNHERMRLLTEVLGRPDAAKALACKDEKLAEALGDCK